ncbi:lasso peptide biosynthesis PqqD family chaperone [Actinomycetota bacterium Odt1-20B]
MATTDTDDATVLLHQRTGRYWQLNATGSYVLRQLLAGQTIDQIAIGVADRYHITHEEARNDVTRVVNQLNSARLLEAS